MSKSFVNPSYYNLQRATIRSEFLPDQIRLDVTALIPSLSISSSTDSETMYGSARIIDTAGVLENLPLRGEEQIILELADSKSINRAGQELVDEPFIFVGFIYKIDDVSSKETNDGVFYNIHFISYQSFKAGTYKIIKSFKDLSISEIAKSIFKDYYDYMNEFKKPLIVEDTSGVIRCIIPSMRPEEAMTFLSKRAYSASESPSCTYRFFESTKGYHFVTDEHLFRLAEEDESRIFNFTFNDSIPDTLDYFDSQLNNLDSLENSKRVNSLDDLYNGAYRNKVIEVDILRRQTNLLDSSNQYDYFKVRDRYFDSKKNKSLKDRHTEAFIANSHRSEEGSDVQKQFMVLTNYDQDRNDSNSEASLPAETHYAEIISNRQAYSKHIESISVIATGPGRFDISAGDIVTLDVKKLQLADGVNVEQNKHLSGNYIVRAVTYNMEQDKMKNYYTLVKKDWSEGGES